MYKGQDDDVEIGANKTWTLAGVDQIARITALESGGGSGTSVLEITAANNPGTSKPNWTVLSDVHLPLIHI